MRNLLFAACLLLLISLYGNFCQWNARWVPEIKSIPVATASPAQPAQVIAARYVAKDSTKHALAAEPVRTRNAAEKADAVGSGYLDSVVKALDVSVKKVDELERTNATLVAKNIRLESSPSKPGRLQYNDKFLHLTYNPDSNLVDSLAYNVELTRVRYWQRAWLLASKRYYNDVFSTDPRVSIDGVRRFTLPEPRPKKFGIGLQAGYGFPIVPAPTFSFQPPAPYIGIGFSYNLIRF